MWLRGPGLSAGWNNGIKLEKDEATPGVYHHDKIIVNDMKALRLTLQNDDNTIYAQFIFDT